MKILDFLVYYMAIWFEQRKAKLQWSTPIQRATYAYGLATMQFFSIGALLYTFISTKNIGLGIPAFWIILIGIGLMQLYQYIYDARKRYELISKDADSRFKISNPTNGIIISICVFFFLFFSPFILCFILLLFK